MRFFRPSKAKVVLAFLILFVPYAYMYLFSLVYGIALAPRPYLFRDEAVFIFLFFATPYSIFSGLYLLYFSKIFGSLNLPIPLLAYLSIILYYLLSAALAYLAACIFTYFIRLLKKGK